MKKCPRCNNEKEYSDFYRNKTKADGHNSWCKECMPVYGKAWYDRNKVTHKARTKIRNDRVRSENKKLSYNYLLAHPCVDCGESDPIVLDYDHQRDKIKAVGVMLCSALSWSTIKKEIDKCEVRCSNCHRRKTAKEQKTYKWERNSMVE